MRLSLRNLAKLNTLNRLRQPSLVTVDAPSGFDWTLPEGFAVQRRGGQFQVADSFDITQYAPTGKIYWVDVNTGNDTTGSGTEGAPWKSVYKAMTQADVDVVYVKPGTYYRQQGGGGTAGVNITRSMSFQKWPDAVGTVYLTIAAGGLSWSLDGTYTNTYTASRSATTDIVDRTQTDANGDFNRYTLRASAADVDANPGSWYISGSTVYVRTIDDRAPDSDILVIVSEGNILPRGDITIYMEDIHMIGGNSLGCVDFQSTATSQTPKFYAKNCRFDFCLGNGVALQGVDTAILQDCIASKNNDDGFNHHARNSIVPHAIEIGCVGRGNGNGNNIDNGSSIHDAGSIIRVNGTYNANIGPNVFDTTGCESWNLGCTANDSAASSAAQDIGFGTQGEMWLDGCVASGNEDDLDPATGGTIYTRNTTYTTTGPDGTITTY